MTKIIPYLCGVWRFANAYIGYDEKGAIRCINVRATDDSDFKKTLYGSDRRFAFRLVSENENLVLHLYEGAIDLLSYITILKEQGVDSTK